MKATLSPLRPDDLPQVKQIEREAFPTLWPPTSFKRGFNSDRYSYVVAWAPREELFPETEAREEPEEQKEGPFLTALVRRVGRFISTEAAGGNHRFALGYVGLWFGADEAHVTDIAVRKGWRGRGIGELLMIGAVEMARLRSCRFITLEVRVSNVVAQSLYAKYGFKEAGMRRGYYIDNHEDAIIMTTDSIESQAYRDNVERLIAAYKSRRGDFQLSLA